MGMRIGIVGGGIAGMVAAVRLCKAGAKVTLMERAGKLGGLAGAFEIGEGQWIEKYYHFICKPDHAYFEMMRELGIENRLRWVTTKMGLYYRGEVHTLGDPVSLFRFPHLGFADKVRFARATLLAKLRGSTGWRKVEDVLAREWLIREYGPRSYEVLYRPLLEQKFREHANRLSAAWILARVYRLGNSRTVTGKERVGYLEGGTQAYVDALERTIVGLGGEIRVNAAVEEVLAENGSVSGVSCDGAAIPFDSVLSTVPIPFANGLFRRFDGPYFQNLRSLEYIGVRVMVLRLARRLTPYFWLNVSDPGMEIAGVIEYTNLNPCSYLGGDSIVYIPQYLPAEHPLYRMPEEELLDLYCGYLSGIRKDFRKDWIKECRVFGDRYAQPICGLGFSAHIPPMRAPVRGLYLTDSYQLHPDDRTVSNSTALGNDAARLILEDRSGA